MSEIELLDNAIDEIEKLNAFTKMAKLGISYAVEGESWVDLKREISKLRNQDDPFGNEEEYVKQKQMAKRDQKHAEREIEQEFSYLYSLATVQLWTILESAIDDQLLKIISRINRKNPPEQLNRLRAPLFSLIEISTEAQNELVLSLLKENISSSLKPGIGAFEALLSALGFGGAVDEIVRRNIFELSQVRNVIVHRGGIADQRFINVCPWYDSLVGAKLKVNENSFRKYMFSVLCYLVDLEIRIIKTNGSISAESVTEKEAVRSYFYEEISKVSICGDDQ